MCVPQAVISEDLSVHGPDSEAQQAAVLAVADRDAFNWGYDPVGVGGGVMRESVVHGMCDDSERGRLHLGLGRES